MSANNVFRVSELDPDGIKNNLISFLQNQQKFSSYNFLGSALNILLEALAYNTHYSGIHANLIGSEMFLDSAVIRDSVVSRAKELNYVPTSRRSAIATVGVTVTPPNGNTTGQLTLPRWSPFQAGQVDGVNYTFTTTDSYTATKNVVSNTFSFPTVVLTEGEHVSQNFNVTAGNILSIFTIPDANIDTSTLLVSVQNSSTDTYSTTYSLANDITAIDANSTVYFLEEFRTGQFAIYFGDGYLGRSLQNNNIILVDYLSSSGTVANYSNNIVSQGSIYGFSNIATTTIVAAAGASEKESIESIKFRAPKAYTSQNRAVTLPDYNVLLPKLFSWIDQVAVWGGDENVPIVYGKVFISIKPKQGYYVTNTLKAAIISTLQSNYSVPTIQPAIVDPDYLYLLISSNVHYDSSKTTLSPASLSQTVVTSIQNYTSNNLGEFDSVFKFSPLGTTIDQTDSSITNNDLEIRLQKQFTPTLNTSKNYSINFGTQLHKGGPDDRLKCFPTFLIADNQGITRIAQLDEVQDSFSGIDSVNVLNPGFNYTDNPDITISGDGTGATATATVVGGKIQSITVTNRGSGYTAASISINPASGDTTGMGAAAEVIVSGQVGVLETFYITSPTGEKIVINDQAGIIDYLNGTITLASFNPIDISANPYYASGILTIDIESNLQTIEPQRNRIITLDSTNPLSTLVTASPN